MTDSNPAPPKPPAPQPPAPQPADPPPTGAEQINWRRWCITIGILMMLVSLGLSVLVPVQTNMLYVANRAFLALGGGLGAGGVLGFLDVDIKVLNHAIRAGGGLAVFVLLFLVNPPALAAVAAAPAARAATITKIIAAATAQSVASTGAESAAEANLNAKAQRLGFHDFRHFRVTATDAQLNEFLGTSH